MIKRSGIFGNYNPAAGYIGWIHGFSPFDIHEILKSWCEAYSPNAQFVSTGCLFFAQPWNQLSCSTQQQVTCYDAMMKRMMTTIGLLSPLGLLRLGLLADIL